MKRLCVGSSGWVLTTDIAEGSFDLVRSVVSQLARLIMTDGVTGGCRLLTADC